MPGSIPWEAVGRYWHCALIGSSSWNVATKDLGFRHVRFHGILNDDMGTLITHQDKPLYSFFNTDRIWDFLLSIGMRPVVELGFMPESLASGSDVVFHFRGNVTPPKDYDQRATLIRNLVGHWVERMASTK